MKRVFFLLLFCLGIAAYAQKNPNVAKTPPLGWNSWNCFGKNSINEAIVMEIIDSMSVNGLRDVGFNYIVIDGGWRDSKLGKDGELLTNPEAFPSGIKKLADYAHSKGFKLGLHTVPGTHDCGGDEVGGFGKEELHVRQMVDWGVDFIKLDLCINKADTCTTCKKTINGWSECLIEEVYAKWSHLLYSSGRDILFSVSSYKFRNWNPALCNMSRTTLDMQCRSNMKVALFNNHVRKNKNYMSVLTAAIFNDKFADFAGNGYWNDPDIMVTGNQGLSDNEQISHIALWSIITAPMMLGNDPRHLQPVEKKMLLNHEVISINQDSSEQGRLVVDKDEYQIWRKTLSNGSAAYLLLNISNHRRKVSLLFKDFNIAPKSEIRDVVNKINIKNLYDNYTVELEPNECSFVVVKR